jgi:hypothetical protein
MKGWQLKNSEIVVPAKSKTGDVETKCFLIRNRNGKKGVERQKGAGWGRKRW